MLLAAPTCAATPEKVKSQDRRAMDSTGGNRHERFLEAEGNFPRAGSERLVRPETGALAHLYLTFIRVLRLGIV
jgi:hypothetical protein